MSSTRARATAESRCQPTWLNPWSPRHVCAFQTKPPRAAVSSESLDCLVAELLVNVIVDERLLLHGAVNRERLDALLEVVGPKRFIFILHEALERREVFEFHDEFVIPLALADETRRAEAALHLGEPIEHCDEIAQGKGDYTGKGGVS